QLRFDEKRKAWLHWKTHWWQVDDTAAVHLAKLAALTRLNNAPLLAVKAEQYKEAKYALRSLDQHKLKAALESAQSEEPFRDTHEPWDANPWLLGVANGVIDLKSGALLPGEPSQRVSQHSEIAYDPAAKCPRWLRFLDEVFEGNTEVITFMQRAFGYSLSGSVEEQCLFFLYGPGLNGKGRIILILKHLLGSYYHDVGFDFFTLSRGYTPHPEQMAACAGRRVITASETGEQGRFNEARLKAMAHGDPLSTRAMYDARFDTLPTAKIWLNANHLPEVRDDSLGMWRTFRIIEMLRKFEGAADDKRLIDKLYAEGPGILNWAVRGCLAWQQDGLGRPRAIEVATKTYEEESDPLREFIEACCVITPESR
ncbi:MAG: hypothetical protein KAX19_00105, partial [Candidatus Brocadiae bacterium]|nr:hypothetical protein [Candidatus Brocadiia bacterium]